MFLIKISNFGTKAADQNQKGVSLIITFFSLSIILATVLGISTIIVGKIKVSTNVGSSLSALNAADSGSEKTTYFDRQVIPNGGTRGICSICSECQDCNNCIATPLELNGCDLENCTDCKVTYSSTFGDKKYEVEATVTSEGLNNSVFSINAAGFYRGSTRKINLTSEQPLIGFIPIIIDNSQAEYTEIGGTWLDWPLGFNGNSHYASPGIGDIARWTFSGLAPGTYIVQATWPADSATDAPYSIYDNTTLLQTIPVNQSVEPSGTVINGRPFQTLASVNILTDTLIVELGSTPTGWVMADAIRIKQ